MSRRSFSNRSDTRSQGQAQAEAAWLSRVSMTTRGPPDDEMRPQTLGRSVRSNPLSRGADRLLLLPTPGSRAAACDARHRAL